MSTIYISQSLISPDLISNVYLDNTLRSDIYCTSYSETIGTSGSSASFDLAESLWDETKRLLGLQIRVDVFYRGSNAKTVFSGFIDAIDRDAEAQQITASAKSVLGFADDIYLIKDNNETRFEIKYTKIAPRDNEIKLTNWDIKQILRDIFSSSLSTWRGGGANIPSNYRSILKLGNMSVFNSVYNKIKLDDIEFKQQTLKEVLDYLLDLLQTVSIRERFEGNICYLDFFELGNMQGSKDMRIAANANASAKGTNILNISKSETIDATKDRVKVVGDQIKHIISIEMIKDWDESLEADVLKNPEGNLSEGEISYSALQSRYWQRREKVFRNYKLPLIFKNYQIDDNLPITKINGEQLPIFIFKKAYKPKFNTLTSEFEAEDLETFELVANGQFDPINLSVILDKPNVYLSRGWVDDQNKPREEYTANKLYITFCYNDGRLAYDSGTKSNNIKTPFDRVQLIEASSFKYIQYGNAGNPAGDIEIPFCYLFDEVNGWQLIEDSVYIDDIGDLELYADIALSELNRKKEAYNISTPFYTNAYRAGDNIIINGEQSGGKIHQIISINHNLGADHGSQIITDNSVPNIASNVLTKEI
jgi:hypothetical protein